MATVSSLIVQRQTNGSADTPSVFYTAPASGQGTRIDAFTAVNNSGVTASYKAYIVPNGLATENPQIPERFVVWGESDLGGNIVNQIIPPNGTLVMESSAANSIYFTVSGSNLS